MPGKRVLILGGVGRLVRLEDGSGNLLGGATGTVLNNDTSAVLAFGDELYLEDIENAIVVIDEC